MLHTPGDLARQISAGNYMEVWKSQDLMSLLSNIPGSGGGGARVGGVCFCFLLVIEFCFSTMYIFLKLYLLCPFFFSNDIVTLHALGKYLNLK